MSFTVIKQSRRSRARLSRLTTTSGVITGPFFMPIATRAAVKNLTTEEVGILGAEIILTNTYHAMLTPGISTIKRAGGIHRFMNWPGPILSDSGGFQVFSLSRLRKVSEHGVKFNDPKSGKKIELTPEQSIRGQAELGVDIAMAFDDVIGYPATKKEITGAMERTSRWAVRCKQAHNALRSKPKPLLFGIVQGGGYQTLREQSAKAIVGVGFDGYAIGGVAVGEPRSLMPKIINWTVPYLPPNQPRYLMGLGRPEEIIAAVKGGIDMFDCVIPTREARHGRLYLWQRSKQFSKVNIQNSKFYHTINITNAKFKTDFSSINNTNLRHYSRAYLHHLFKTNEPLGLRLATLNNLDFYLKLMWEIRRAIRRGTF